MTKKIILTLIVFFSSFFAVSNVLGAEIAFPIAELGNCADKNECRVYCDDPLNRETCTSFAKQKGFYKEEEIDQDVVLEAKRSLGCDSGLSCRSFCEKEENFDKCHEFAKGKGLSGGYKEDTTKGEILNKAKEVLGCKSYEVCKSFCDNPANRDKCSQFAAEVGVRGGYEYRGPGGCTTEENCKAYCQNNQEICKEYRSNLSGVENYYRDPKLECSKYNGCSWTGSYCNCSNSNGGYQDRLKAECVKYPGCNWGGNSCQCSTTNVNYDQYYRDPQSECTKYAGCKWEANSCQCSGKPTTYFGGETNPEASCKSALCTWKGDYCDCANVTSGPMYECVKKSGCSWINSTCQCSGFSSGGSGYTPRPYPTYQSSDTGSSWSKEQQEVGCRAGGGVCDWSSGYCYCKGYTSPTGSSGGSYTTPTPYSGGGSTMTREQQESTCRSGGGTCSWNGDTCNCQGYQSSGSSSDATPQPQIDPATQCTSYPGCTWNGSMCQCSTVQGVATVYARTWWQKLLDLLQ